MSAYYNEIEPYAAEWLKNLISANLIAHGDVDTRSILDVAADDLRGYAQCHFFAGIGLWSHALRLAGWADERPVWTGSCPCQPFSAAGKQRGKDDERHLFPAWFGLIRERRPAIVFGEQVEAAIRLGWLDAVQDDMEREGYAIGKVVLPAASVGAPHIRHRLYFVANNDEDGCRTLSVNKFHNEKHNLESCGEHDGMANSDESGRPWNGEVWQGRASTYGRGEYGGMADSGIRDDGLQYECANVGRQSQNPEQVRLGGCLGNAKREGLERLVGDGDSRQRRACAPGSTAASGGVNNPWSDVEFVWCRDGKYRPIKPKLVPLVNGDTGRMGKLRAYGNAIVPQVAAEFIKAFMQYRP